MDTVLCDWLEQTLGIPPIVSMAVLQILSWLAGIGVLGYGGRRVVATLWTLAGRKPSEPLTTFLEAIRSEEARYDEQVVENPTTKAKTTSRLLSVPHVIVAFNDDQIGGVKCVEVENSGPCLLTLLDDHERRQAERAAVRRRDEVIERDRKKAAAAAAASMSGKVAAAKVATHPAATFIEAVEAGARVLQGGDGKVVAVTWDGRHIPLPLHQGKAA